MTRLSLHAFFVRALEDQPWHGPAERSKVERFRVLVRFLATALEQTLVFRIGTIEVAAYAFGRTLDG